MFKREQFSSIPREIGVRIAHDVLDSREIWIILNFWNSCVLHLQIQNEHTGV